jgi:hypothetical protein
VVAVERGYSAIVELLERDLAEPTQVKPKSLRSNIQIPNRTEAFAATKRNERLLGIEINCK